MTRLNPVSITSAALAALLFGLPTIAQAQFVPIRTVPVASGDQFLTVPSASLAIGGLGMAVDDSIADGWRNPAKGILIPESSILGSPTFYGISDNGGGGKTLPITALLKGERWFGGVSAAIQQITNENRAFWFEPFVLESQVPDYTGPTLADENARNLYARGFLGRRVGDGPWTIGLGVSLSDLKAMDGVDLLYDGSDYISQSGTITDLRVGGFRSSERDRLGLVFAHNRVSMTHEVGYTEWEWPEPHPDSSFIPEPSGEPTRRVELNEDRTRSWGLRLDWDRTLSAPGWRTGATMTANLKTHPKIPNYSIQNIPRDPGTTWAFELGYGASRTVEATTFGIEVAVQPIWSHTWQEADEPIETLGGRVIDIGGRTIENDFDITNVVMRIGASHEEKGVRLSLGLEAISRGYTLTQQNHIEDSTREQDESWMEWMPSWGVSRLLSGVELRYSGRATTGTGQPGLNQAVTSDALEVTPDFILAPSGQLTLLDATVLTHQLWVRVPIN